MRQALIIFAKAPVPGKVKTRLVPPLNYAQAAELQKCFLQDTLDLAGKAKDCDLIIAYTPPSRFDSLKALITSSEFKFVPQLGSNLGEKMHNAFQDVFKLGSRRAVIIGTDLPTLPPYYLNKAFDLLGKCDVVIGPNVDGGYYLIGMRGNRRKGALRRVFSGVSWSTEDVLPQTLERINKAGLKLGCLDVWYDVDTPSSLRFLKSHVEYLKACGEGIPKRTYGFLRRLKI